MSHELPRSRGLVLVGYRGTGKSTVGRLVAERLGRMFVDADATLEERLGRRIREIFTESGESFFRDREQENLAALMLDPGRVIATGGGVVLRANNRVALRHYGVVVWLTGRPDVLAERLRLDPSGTAARPALTPSGTLGEIVDVLKFRTPLYREVADLEVATDERGPSEVADAIVSQLRWE